MFVEEKIIQATQFNIKVKLKYYWSIGIILILLSFSIAWFTELDPPHLLLFGLGVFLFSSLVPNYITLYLIKCPYCSKKYFNPKMCTQNELINIFRSRPSCVNCNQNAIIISGENSDHKV